MDIKISVIIPVYNAEQYLKDCVDSIINQSYQNFELILVDDGSSDNSPKICDDYDAKDNRIIVIHKSNNGVSEARKTGLDNASGDYIMYVDSDDWLDINTMERCIGVVHKNPKIGCVMFSFTKEVNDTSQVMHVFDGNCEFLDSDKFQKCVYRRLFGLSNEELSHPERLENLTTCWMKLYRSDLAKQGDFIDIKKIGSCEDGIYNMYALRNCDSAVYIDEPLYHYRKIKGSLSDVYRGQLIEQWKCLFGIMQKFINDEKLPEKFQESLNNRIALSIIGIGMNELCNPETDFGKLRKYIKKYISDEEYSNSYSTLKLDALPIAWKVLIFCCKKRLSFMVCLILHTIRAIK